MLLLNSSLRLSKDAVCASSLLDVNASDCELGLDYIADTNF